MKNTNTKKNNKTNSKKNGRTNVCSVRLTPEAIKALRTISAREGRSFSGLCSWVLLNYAVGGGKVRMTPKPDTPATRR